jgi:hypothetical protein
MTPRCPDTTDYCYRIAAELIAAKQHRHTARKRERSQQILDLSNPHALNPDVITFAFDTMIRAEILVGAVAIALTVGEIVLDRVTDNIVERQSVMGSDEVDAVDGALPLRS